MMTTNDYFSLVSENYLKFRPSYPPELFSYVASLPDERQCAWDCGTGNGQAALGLAPYFDRVIATDISEAQLARALPHAKITYLVASAEQSHIASHSVDLITAAQSLHWFDFPLFFAEARRVLKANGYVAAWTYPFMTFQDPKINQVFQNFALKDLRELWPKERAYCDNRYRDIPFELKNLTTRVYITPLQWDLAQVLGYTSSWSAVNLYKQKFHEDPIATMFLPLISPIWGQPQQTRSVHLEIILKVGRV